MKRLLSILLCAAMLIGLLPTVAWAGDPAPETETADFTIDDDGVAAITLLGGTDKATWVGTTLTLKGVDFTTTAATAVKLPAGSTIVLEGDNTIASVKEEAQQSSYGIEAEGNLTIRGTGTLTVEGGAAGRYNSSFGIYVKGNLTISEGTVTATGGKADWFSNGIYAFNTVTINSGTVIAEGGEAAFDSCGINAVSVTIEDGTVTAEGGVATGGSVSAPLDDTGGSSDTTYGESYGIYADASVTITGGTVTAKGGEVNSDYGKSYGIYAEDTVKIADGTVEATGDKASEYSEGIEANNVTIEDGTVKATGGEATGEAGESYGICAVGYYDNEEKQSVGGNVTISSGTVTATGGTAGEYSDGIYACDGSVTIVKGEVYATGGEAGYESSGIFADDSVAISGGTVNATGGTATGEESISYGIYAYNSLEIAGGTVNATGGEAGRDGCGITVLKYDSNDDAVVGTITISGGHVTAQTLAKSAAVKAALNVAPVLTNYATYSWRTATADAFTASATTPYTYSADHTYFEIAEDAITYTNTVVPPVNGAVTVLPKAPAPGNTVTITTTPNEGFKLSGKPVVTGPDGAPVEVTDNGDGTFTFKQPDGDVTVTVTFSKKDSDPDPDTKCDGGSSCPSRKFTDLDPTQWYHEAVDYAIDNDLMNGVSDTSFAPGGTTNRAMLVTVLYRLEGEPEVGTCKFTDVKPGLWYSNAVAWAEENKIVLGYGNGKFGPMDTLTREQFATILYRYAEYKGYDTEATADLSIFTDGNDTVSWAKDAMSWAVAKKLFIGDDGKLNPHGDASRAQMAIILYRFIQNVAK